MSSHKPRGTTLVFIALVVFLDSMGVGLIIPVMPNLLGELTNLPNAKAAEISGYLVFTYAGMQFFAGPVLGGLSDRYGRRPVLLLSLLGFSLDYFVMALAPSLIFLFIARFLSGIFGATYTAANAAIVDSTNPDSRAKAFGVIGAASGVGLIVGPLIGGYLGEYSTRLPFIVAGMLALAACIYGYFAFPETLKVENKRPFEWVRANPLGSIWALAQSPAGKKLILPILAVLFFLYLANQSYIVIWSFFTIEVVGWSPSQISWSVACYGLSMAIVQGILTGHVVKAVGEVRAIYFSLIIGAVVFICLGFARGGFAIYSFILLGALSGFAFPSLQALMTRSAPENAQGELQGANASIFSLSSIFGPLLMPFVFASYSDDQGYYFPGAAFFVSASLVIASLFIFVWSQKATHSNVASKK